jgi:hypothetical protein
MALRFGVKMDCIIEMETYQLLNMLMVISFGLKMGDDTEMETFLHM